MESNSVSTSLYKRMFIMLIAFLVFFGFLIYRIFALQTKDYEEYQKEVIEQMTSKSVVPAGRGDIYDTNGVLLATDKTVYRIFISPNDIRSAEEENKKAHEKDSRVEIINYKELIAENLSEILGVDYDKIIERADRVNRLDETIKKEVEDEETELVRRFIKEYKLQNMVHVEATSKRYYCYDSLASTVLGFTGADNNGLYGLEYEYEDELSGTDGVYITARDSYGKELPTEYESYIEAKDGLSLVTTLDMYIQHELENQLRQTLLDNGGDERVCGIVMDVKTGGILGMATIPDFNCNQPQTLNEVYADILASSGLEEGSDEYNDKRYSLLSTAWSNKCITGTYMPGSTFKVLTTAMCLEEKLVTTSESFYCPGYYMVPGYSKPIHCHKTKGHGHQDFRTALQQSCNPALMEIGLRLGSERFYDYFGAFGLLDKTGIDLPGEANSIFHEVKNFNQVELATAAFGQNFKVTPIQQITAISAVANGGYLVTPHLVKEMIDSEGNVVYSYDSENTVRQVISADVCATITDILEEGVSGDGGAKNAYVAGYRIAAKTGTSEKKDKKDENGETPYRIGSTIAYAPAEDPQVAVLIIVDEPTKGSVYGSIVAAPYVANVMASILPYLGVEAEYTEEELENITKIVPNYVGWSVEDAKTNLGYRKLDYEIVGTGDKVTSIVPAGGSAMRNDGKIYLYTGDEAPKKDVTVPDVVGKSATVTNMMVINSGLNIQIKGAATHEGGTGPVAVSQSPAAGERVPKGTVVTVEFRYLDGTD